MSGSSEESNPTRVSGRIKARRHQQHFVEEQRDVSSSASTSTSNKAPDDTENAPLVKISSTKKKKKPEVAKDSPPPPRKEPPRSSPPPKSPQTPVKKVPNPFLPCRKPPYPFYNPTEKPTFEKGIESLVHILRSSRNIAVLTGAGISVSCGIPDFRSKGVGLYSVLDCGSLGLSCPEELFDWEFFQNNPSPFFQFAKKLYFPLENNKKVQPSDSHKLLRLLQDRKQLLRVYSQNIDGLEEEAGVLSKKVVYAHGSLKWATCLTCKRKFPAGELEQSILEGAIPYCQVIPPTRPSKAQSKQSTSGSLSSNDTNNVFASSMPLIRREPSSRNRKRPRPVGDEEENNVRTSTRLSRSSSTSSTPSSSKSNVCGGILKPNVTFFGQVLPDNVCRCLEADRKKVDALIVIGTSLSVAPISKVIGYLPANIPRILINRTIAHPRCHPDPDKDDDHDTGEESDEEAKVPDFRDGYVFDAYLLGNCDDVTRALVKQLRADDPSSDAPPKPLNDIVEMGRLLSEVREDSNNGNEKNEEALYHAEEWETATVPSERVFLFPGAQPPSPFMEESPVKLQEVCHCNACAKRILRGHIHKCLQCFDYDLCSTCFPKVSRNHYDGLHQFGIEKVQVVSGRR